MKSKIKFEESDALLKVVYNNAGKYYARLRVASLVVGKTTYEQVDLEVPISKKNYKLLVSKSGGSEAMPTMKLKGKLEVILD